LLEIWQRPHGGERRERGMAVKVPAGYKQTELGVIPEQWSVKLIGDLQLFVTSGSRGWATFYSDRGFPFIRIANLRRDCIYPNLDDLQLVNIPENASEAVRTKLQDGDVLISITADIGVIGYVTKELQKPAYINQHIALVRLEPDSVFAKFVGYFLASESSQRRLRALTDAGAKAGMSLTTVKQTPVALPPTNAEQEAIAEALSDADALIESLDQLIAKKRQIKQGTVQELLTGKRRLPGFDGEWEVKRLGDVASFLKGKGLSKSALVPNGEFACIHYGELFTKYAEIINEISSRTNESEDSFRSISNDVLMPTSDVTPRGLAKASCVTLEDVILGGDILVIRSDTNRIVGSFLSYVIRFQEKQVLQLVTGSTVFHLYGTDMKKFVLSIPSLEEQTAIATLLSDMDAEITALESRLAKARQIKQGMMQELLTGRIRLL